jgi:hypothetical protein
MAGIGDKELSFYWKRAVKGSFILPSIACVTSDLRKLGVNLRFILVQRGGFTTFGFRPKSLRNKEGFLMYSICYFDLSSGFLVNRPNL